MSCNLYKQKYELDDLKVNIYDRADLNKVVLSNTENLNHFSSKAILFYILREMEHDVISEYHIVGVGRVDIYDLTTRTIYQFQILKLLNDQLIQNDILQQKEVDVGFVWD